MSWIIRDKRTGEVICETYSDETVKIVDRYKFEVVSVMQYLTELNSKIKAEKSA